MSNPVLTDRFFRDGGSATIDATSSEVGSGYGAPPTAPTATDRGVMTMGGVASASGVMLLVLMVAAWFGWNQVESVAVPDGAGRMVEGANFPGGLVLGSVLVGFVLAMICCFKPGLAKFLAVPYSIAEGLFLGAISHAYDIRTQGVALQAVIATVAVFAVMLALYGFRVLRVTPRMTKAIIAATFGVMAIYLVGFIASFFTDAPLRFMDSTSGLSIGISFLVVGLAAFNLLLDFDFIEKGVARQLPKEMEWFAAFGLVVTLVWLYLELLRLLSKLQRR